MTFSETVMDTRANKGICIPTTYAAKWQISAIYGRACDGLFADHEILMSLVIYIAIRDL
jgi:hypothetical protein